mgnify:CR=1 FL=1
MTDKKDPIAKQMEIQRKYKNTFDNIINKSPKLKKLKDQTEGLTHRGTIVASDSSQEYKDNYDKIDWGNKDTTKRKYKVKINGVYVDDQEEE